MPVDALRVPGLTRSSDSCVVRPDRRAWLESHGLTTARDYLALAGVVVSGHVGRNVSRVRIGPTTAYLKREHRVRLRDRFRSWRAGFGWVSLSEREALVLRRLAEYELPGPDWLAHGEADGEAFLLVEAAEGAVPLRSLALVRPELAEHLGRVIARIHAAGIDQPDLFAKHVLIHPDTGRLTILDWQRATLRKCVPRPNRIRALSAFRATSPESHFPMLEWNRLLAGYAAVAGWNDSSLEDDIEAAAGRLLHRGAIRSQRLPQAEQELVRIDGETVCAIPAVANDLNSLDMIAALYDPENDGQTVAFRGGRSGVLRIRRHTLPFSRWWGTVRGKVWRSPELKVARLLFHLERHGIPAPKLLAYGQTDTGVFDAGSFVLVEPPAARPAGPDDRDEVEALLARLHAAGCSLRELGKAGEPFGFVGSTAIVTEVGQLRLQRHMSARRVRHEVRALSAFFGGGR